MKKTSTEKTRNRRRAICGNFSAVAWQEARRPRPRPAYERDIEDPEAYMAHNAMITQRNKRKKIARTTMRQLDDAEASEVLAAYDAGERAHTTCRRHAIATARYYDILVAAKRLPPDVLTDASAWVTAQYLAGEKQYALARMLAVAQPAINVRIHRHLAGHGNPWVKTPRIRTHPFDADGEV